MSEMSMVERVARAVAPNLWQGFDEYCAEKELSAEEIAEEKRMPALRATFLYARSILEGMRAPTPTMADAAYQRMLMGRCSTEEEARQLFAEGWQAAIDAALNE